MKLQCILLLALTFAMASCAVGPEYKAPAVEVPASWHETLLGVDTVPMQAEWWRTFGDPMLDRLMVQAAHDNLDLARAVAVLRAARAKHSIADTSRYPAGRLNASAVREHESGNVPNTSQGQPGETGNLFLAGFDAEWEIDLFGARKHLLEAAAADVDTAEHDSQAVRLSVLAEVARSYADLRGTETQIALARESIAVAEDMRTLAQSRLAGGIGSNADVSAAEADLANAQAAIDPLDAVRSVALHRLAVLLGQAPGTLDRELADGSAIPVPPDALPPVLPSDLLRQRPDIRAAERRVAAATARVGMAQADWYPRFSLTGDIGFASSALENLPNGASRAWSIGPSLSWPILRAGQIAATVSVRDAELQAALISYRQAILTALEDTENALAAYRREWVRHARLAIAVAAAQDRVALAQSRFKGGLADFRLVLAERKASIAAREAMSHSAGALALDWIALHKALGTGWSETSGESRPRAANRCSEVTVLGNKTCTVSR